MIPMLTRTPRLPLVITLLLLVAPRSLALAVDAHAAWGAAQQARRIVAVGDIHGAADSLAAILQSAGLVDGARRWIGGAAHLVQTGDYLDRGKDVRAVLDLLMRLEGEASRAGGRVDVLFGNHEGMNVLRDLRDVSPEAYAAFVDGRSEERRRRAFEAHAAIAKRTGATLASEPWMAAHPLGQVEYLEALGAKGRYGRWLRARQVVLQIGETIFMHAGLDPERTTTIDEVNRGVAREIREWDDLVATLERQRLIAPAFTLGDIAGAVEIEVGRIALALKNGEAPGDHVTRFYVEQLQRLGSFNSWALIDPAGPLWYRGLATLPEVSQPAIDALLGRLHAARVVAGHTPQVPDGRIGLRFAGRVLLIDTGMLASHYKGRPSALEIQGDRLTAIYASGREELGAGTASPVNRRF